MCMAVVSELLQRCPRQQEMFGSPLTETHCGLGLLPFAGDGENDSVTEDGVRDIVTDAQVRTLFVDNPRRFLAAR